ncbi:MAG: hypothetical protein ACP5OP_05455 [Leptospirillia bacterium]
MQARGKDVCAICRERKKMMRETEAEVIVPEDADGKDPDDRMSSVREILHQRQQKT